MSTTRRNFITGHWISGQGTSFHSIDPATGAKVWEGRAATESDVSAAIASARAALPAWADLAAQERIDHLLRYADVLRQRKNELAEAICLETGKPLWEALGEADAMIGKVPISIDAMQTRRGLSEQPSGGATAATRYKPMGVMAVFGPFNMPGHLPNGHLVPALLAGNAVVFKPSELTPGVGEKMAECLHAADIPHGVVNLLQGGRDIGALLGHHAGVDGILFTGSAAAGLALNRAAADHPGKILALEMGGNNPLVIWDVKDLDAAAYLTIQSAYITSGQRCSCARRLIIPDDARGIAFIERLIDRIGAIRVGPHTRRPEPFMGPVISDAAAAHLLAAQQDRIEAGGIPLVKMTAIGDCPAMLRPGLIDVTRIVHRSDAEIFGPLLQIIRVADFDAAIAEANRTEYGLAAGLFSDDANLWRRFYRSIRAGVVYWNRQTTGGSSALPFGGIGLSGNFRPSGSWAADYCSYPVASIETPALQLPSTRTPGME